MSFYCYIIYSDQLDKYYIGESEDVEKRIVEHNGAHYKGAFTSQVNDWKLFWSYQLTSRADARKLETFIKNMKSRSFIQKLASKPELIIDILNKFKGPTKRKKVTHNVTFFRL
ncbi:MAG: GIY-YIG nuclease family protein [Bacteroidetes bacterium]|nr:GIY-YIG nuclease family protein [Bacteroidota bacterium]MDA1121103.1 GIY-YIG nuclease family protein [Bacteroidota bacterium]